MVLVAVAVVVVLGVASVFRYFDCHSIRPSLIADPSVQLVWIIPVPLLVGLAAVAVTVVVVVVGDGVAVAAGGDVTAAGDDGADVGLVLRLMALIVSHLSPYSMTDPCVDQP